MRIIRWVVGLFRRRPARPPAYPLSVGHDGVRRDIKPDPKRGRLLWVGDGMTPAGAHLVGRPIEVNGRSGVIVETTALTVTVEWDCPLSGDYPGGYTTSDAR